MFNFERSAESRYLMGFFGSTRSGSNSWMTKGKHLSMVCITRCISIASAISTRKRAAARMSGPRGLGLVSSETYQAGGAMVSSGSRTKFSIIVRFSPGCSCQFLSAMRWLTTAAVTHQACEGRARADGLLKRLAQIVEVVVLRGKPRKVEGRRQMLTIARFPLISNVVASWSRLDNCGKAVSALVRFCSVKCRVSRPAEDYQDR